MRKEWTAFIAIVFITLGFTRPVDCNLLPDGLYKLIYTRPVAEPTSFILIHKGHFTQYTGKNDTAKGTINWLYECMFLLEYEPKRADTSYYGQHSDWYGRPCIELDKSNGDTLFFRTTYTANLRITSNEGYFTRQQ